MWPVAGYEEYVRHDKERVARRARFMRTRQEAARTTALALAQWLAAHFQVDRVYLFGSVVTGRFSMDSDLDLACVGLAPERYFAAWSELNDATDFRVDLVCLEGAPETLQDRILAEGVVLFDRVGGAGHRLPAGRLTVRAT